MTYKKYRMLLHGAVLACVLLAPGSSWATTISAVATRDNTIYDNGNSNSTGQGLFVGMSGAGVVQRGLIAFDISAIPAGVTIDSVTLTLHVNAEAYLQAPETITVNRLTAGWGEGTTGAGGPSSGGGNGVTPVTGDATWTAAFHAISNWSTAGGDFDPVVSASVTVDGLGFFSWSGAGLIADVQSWVDGGNNYGWILQGNEADAGSSKRFSSRENTGGGGTNVPVLTIDYSVMSVPVPATPWLFSTGLAALLGLGRRRRVRQRRRGNASWTRASAAAATDGPVLNRTARSPVRPSG